LLGFFTRDVVNVAEQTQPVLPQQQSTLAQRTGSRSKNLAELREVIE
jgi:hypothetical protein